MPDLLSRKHVNEAGIYRRKVGTTFFLARRASIPPAATDYLRHHWGAPIVAGYVARYCLATHTWERFDPWEDMDAQSCIHGDLARGDVCNER